MPVSEVMAMIGEALVIMCIGVGGVFTILALFYGSLKYMGYITKIVARAKLSSGES